MARMIASWLETPEPPKTPECPLLNPEGAPVKAPPPLLLVVLLPLSNPAPPTLLLPSREWSRNPESSRGGTCGDPSGP